MKFLFIVLPFFLFSCLSRASTEPVYKSTLSSDWTMKKRSDEGVVGPTSWKSKKNSHAVITLSFHEMKENISRAPASVRKISPGEMTNLAEERQRGLSAIRITGWTIEAAEERPISKYQGIEFVGHYTSPSGATVCFVERQVQIRNSLVQLVSTDRKNTSKPCEFRNLRAGLETFSFE